MQHNNHDFFCDLLIKFTKGQILYQNHQSIKYELWRQSHEKYERAIQDYNNNLVLLKRQLLLIIDNYWEKQHPNVVACKMLGCIFTCIQSINDIESGKKSFQDIDKLCLLINQNKGLVSLYNKIMLIHAKLAYFFDPGNGILIKPDMSSLFIIHKDSISMQLEKINNKIKEFVIDIIHSQYVSILNTQPEISYFFKKIDKIQFLIKHYNQLKTDFFAMPFYEYRKYANLYYRKKDYHEYLKDYYYQEALFFYKKDTRPIFSILQEKMKFLMEEDEKKYFNLEKKLDELKFKILFYIYRLTNTYGSAVEQSWDELINFLDKKFPTYHGLFNTTIHEKCKRLSILMGQKLYFSFIKNICYQIDKQFGLPYVNKIPCNNQKNTEILTPSSKDKDNSIIHFNVFGKRHYQLWGNQPRFNLINTFTLGKGGAVYRLYEKL